MTTIGRGSTAHHLEKVEAPGSMLTKTAAKALAVLRISTGFIFLWAFLDKTFGFGYATPSAKAWINGGSPTKGFLSSVDVGPSGLQTFFHNIAGDPWANWLFMLGLLGIGLAFVLGIGMRLAAGAAVLMMAMMWLAELPLDKTFALGFSTGVSPDGASTDRFGPAAWIHGGNPTQGFLAFGAKGPFEGFYHSIAGATWVNWLFMLGLLGIGLALTFGVAMRFAAAAGAVMYVLMWTVALPPENNPVIDEHLLGAITVVALALLSAGNTWGLGRRWSRIDAVERYPVLR